MGTEDEHDTIKALGIKLTLHAPDDGNHFVTIIDVASFNCDTRKHARQLFEALKHVVSVE